MCRAWCVVVCDVCFMYCVMIVVYVAFVTCGSRILCGVCVA